MFAASLEVPRGSCLFAEKGLEAAWVCNVWHFRAFSHNILHFPFVIFRFIVNSNHICWEHVEAYAQTKSEGSVAWKDANGPLTPSSSAAWSGLELNRAPASPPLDVQGFYINKKASDDKWKPAAAAGSQLT